MKTVLCYGDSNTFGSATDGRASGRYEWHERWPGVLAAALGEGYRVVEEGLGGRTAVFDDPVEGAARNGRTYLEPCLLSHRPLDLVVVMLGTNDLKVRFNVPAREIAAGVGRLVDDIHRMKAGKGRDAMGIGPGGGVPEVLIISPAPPSGLNDELGAMFLGYEARVAGMPEAYAAMAKERGVHFLDAAPLITVSTVDGLHLDVEMHERLGSAVADKVREILS